MTNQGRKHELESKKQNWTRKAQTKVKLTQSRYKIW